MKTFILYPFLLLFATTLLAQQTEVVLTPDQANFKTEYIQNEVYRMKWFIVTDSSKMDIGQLTINISKKNGKLLIEQIVKMNRSASNWVDSTIADLPDLKPLYHSSYNGQRDMVLHFGNNITGYYLDKRSNKKYTITENTTTEYFDSNIYPYLIRFLPLKENYETVISIYNYNPNRSGTMNAHVKDVQKGFLNEKKVWIVKVTDDISNNSVVSTYYIEQRSRRVLKQEIIASGRRMVMELME